MKTTTDIPDEAVREAVPHAVEMTKRKRPVIANEEPNRGRRLARLAEGLGSFEGFPSRPEIISLRSAS